MLIPPGELYDPPFMLPWGNTILMDDDGKAIGDHGGRILSITPQDHISLVMDADQLPQIIGFDQAPIRRAVLFARARDIRHERRTD
jgi:hypothetical protein